MAKSKKMYPVTYKGREYKEEDCDDLFNVFYHERDSLEDDGSVYMLGGDYVYPDGTIREGSLTERYGIFLQGKID